MMYLALSIPECFLKTTCEVAVPLSMKKGTSILFYFHEYLHCYEKNDMASYLYKHNRL